MKKIYIVSKQTNGKHSEIASFLNKFSKNEIFFENISYSDFEFFMGKFKIGIVTDHTPTLKINNKDIDEKAIFLFRIGQYKLREIASSITLYLDRKKIENHNSLYTSISYGGKLFQNLLYAFNKLPIPATIFMTKKNLRSFYKELDKYFEFPIIMKATSSSLGRDNYLIDRKEDVLEIIKKYEEIDKEFILQEFIPHTYYYRILVLGKRKIGSVLRREMHSYSNHEDQRIFNDAPIEVDIKKVPRELKNIALKASKLLGLDVAGVDIITSKNGNHYLIETNPSPDISLNTAEGTSLYKYLVKK
jgi:glutathione synthase/RimK-type ligase-like ATP-grasp enzyme